MKRKENREEMKAKKNRVIMKQDIYSTKKEAKNALQAFV
jgi:uncharacterized protein YegP (UPF0339 family)